MDMEIDDADFCDIGEEVFEPEVRGPNRPNVQSLVMLFCLQIRI